MEVSEIIAGIDAQIKKLTEARAILEGVTAPAAKSKRGRPKGSKTTPAVHAAPAKAAKAVKTETGKRKLSPEGRKRIADAMKRRWAERRKTAIK